MLGKEEANKKDFQICRGVIRGFQNRLIEEFRELSERGKAIPLDLMMTIAICQIAVAIGDTK